MNKRICPRCDRAFREWQPVHLYCFADRLRYWFLGIGAVFLLLIVGLNYLYVAVSASNALSSEKSKSLTPLVETIVVASTNNEPTSIPKSPTSTQVTNTPSPTRIRPTATPSPVDAGGQNSASDSLQPTSSHVEDPTATLRPTRTPTPTRKPISTSTPRPEPTATFTPAPTPFTCSKSATGEFAGVWRYYGARLGCPI